MIHAALRDLVFRRRRYLISTIGCGLVFAIGLVMTGLSDAFPDEWERTVQALGARSFVLPSELRGPFSGASPFEIDKLPPGVEPLAYAVQTATVETPVTVAMIGLAPDSPSVPLIDAGRGFERAGEVLVSTRSPFRIGDDIAVSGHSLRVVGTIGDLSVNGGMPAVVVPLGDAQQILYRGLPLAGAGIVRTADRPTLSEGFRAQPEAEAREDALRLLASARKSIDFVKILLWLVAALIIGSVTFLSVIERLRDFAVFKAIGTPATGIAAGVVLQTVALALLSSVLGIGLGWLIAPFFPLPVVISPAAALLLPALGAAVGVIASLFALSRALRVEPALAFGSAA